MTLTKKDALNICTLYDLGEYRSIEYIPEGLINHTYTLRTSKGLFIVQVIQRAKENGKLAAMKLEFAVLLHLKENDFPYEVPTPIEVSGSKQQYISLIGSNHLWVYKKLNGRMLKRISKEQLREVAVALAQYHRAVDCFGVAGTKKNLNDYTHLKRAYLKLSKVTPASEIDSVMKEQYDFFYGLLEKLQQTDLNARLIPVHKDFRKTNLLFRDGVLTGIIDFDLLTLSNRMEDLANAIDGFCFTKKGFDVERCNFFLNEYETICNISKKERAQLFPFIQRTNVANFWWFYAEMDKRPDLKLTRLRHIVKKARSLNEHMRW